MIQFVQPIIVEALLKYVVSEPTLYNFERFIISTIVPLLGISLL